MLHITLIRIINTIFQFSSMKTLMLLLVEIVLKSTHRPVLGDKIELYVYTQNNSKYNLSTKLNIQHVLSNPSVLIQTYFQQ